MAVDSILNPPQSSFEKIYSCEGCLVESVFHCECLLRERFDLA